MRLLTQKAEIRYSFIVFSVLLFLISLLTIFYGFDTFLGEKWGAIISGLLTGLIVFAFQIWLSWKELLKLDEYDALKIIKILPRRDDRDYYENLISSARKNISVLGVTAHRFLEHFANEESSREGAKTLLSALGKNVEVRILIASPDSLSDEKNKNKAKMAESALKKLAERFSNFKYGYFNHQPMHSILTVDDESIVGPVFPGVNSEFTPAIHIKNDSEFVTYYLSYFEREWNECSKNKTTS